MGVAGALREAGDWDAVACAGTADVEAGGGVAGTALRLTGDGEAKGDNPALIQSAGAGTECRGAGAEREPFSKYLRLGPCFELSFSKSGDVFQHGVDHAIAGSGHAPRLWKDVIGPCNLDLGGIVISGEEFGVEDDIGLQITSLAEVGGGSSIGKIAHVDDTGSVVETALLRGVDDGIIEEDIKISLLSGRGLVAIKKQISDGGDLGCVGAVIATGDGTGTVGGAVTMAVEKDVALDPRVGAVQIKLVIGGSRKNIVQKLDDSLIGTVASGEVHDVVVPDGSSEKGVAQDPAPAGLDAAGSVH